MRRRMNADGLLYYRTRIASPIGFRWDDIDYESVDISCNPARHISADAEIQEVVPGCIGIATEKQ